MPDELDGNESQNRKIARQMFRAWSEDQEAKATQRILSGSAPAWIACILSLALLVWNAAVISGNVAENTRRIDKIESEQKQAASEGRQVLERMARIEAKLDLAIGEKQK